MTGQLHNVSSASSVQVNGLPAGSGATDVSAGGDHACAVANGAVLCWGANGNGTLGDGTYTSSLVPVVAVASGATSVSTSIRHTCAVVNGGAKCWGRTWYGALGNGTNNDYSVPTLVYGLSSGVASVAVSDYHSCALMTSGAVKCWGMNRYGELGDGTLSDSGVPVNVTGINSGASDLSMGPYGACAVVNQTLKCWGGDQFGLLGDQPNIYSNTIFTPQLAGSPVKLSISGPGTSTALTCSAPFTIFVKDINNNSVATATNTTVSLSDNGVGGNFYSSAGCASGSISSVSIGSGASSAVFYYKAPAAQDIGIGISATGMLQSSIRHVAN